MARLGCVFLAEDNVALLDELQLKAFLLLIPFISALFTFLTFLSNCWTVGLEIL
jgi:hypothetical protein